MPVPTLKGPETVGFSYNIQNLGTYICGGLFVVEWCTETNPTAFGTSCLPCCQAYHAASWSRRHQPDAPEMSGSALRTRTPRNASRVRLDVEC